MGGYKLPCHLTNCRAFMLKKYLIFGAVCFIVGGLFCGAIVYNLFLPPSGQIVVKPPIVTPTVWTDKEHAKNTSPLQIAGKLNNKKLGVDCWDDEKKIHADFSISCMPKVRHNIFQINYLLLSKRINPNYYYSFGRVALGGGIIVPLTGKIKDIDCLVGVQINY
jgi:hypothetical protein